MEGHARARSFRELGNLSMNRQILQPRAGLTIPGRSLILVGSGAQHCQASCCWGNKENANVDVVRVCKTMTDQLHRSKAGINATAHGTRHAYPALQSHSNHQSHSDPLLYSLCPHLYTLHYTLYYHYPFMRNVRPRRSSHPPPSRQRILQRHHCAR